MLAAAFLMELCELSESLNENFYTKLDCSLPIYEMTVKSIEETQSKEEAEKLIKELNDNFPQLRG